MLRPFDDDFEKDKEAFKDRIRMMITVANMIVHYKRKADTAPAFVSFLIHKYAPVILIPLLDTDEFLLEAIILVDRVQPINMKRRIVFPNIDYVMKRYHYIETLIELS